MLQRYCNHHPAVQQRENYQNIKRYNYINVNGYLIIFYKFLVEIYTGYLQNSTDYTNSYNPIYDIYFVLHFNFIFLYLVF